VVTNHPVRRDCQGRQDHPASDGKEAKSVVFVQSPGKDEMTADFAYAGAVTSMVP
jgi:quinone-modifying oxidoreductase subunit QmoB